MIKSACSLTSYTPSHILLQWHITNRCTNRCVHCYQESFDGSELPFSDLLAILEQYTTLLKSFRRQSGSAVRGHITLTGGEPFIRSDCMDLLNQFHAHRDLFSFGILTNGALITQERAEELKAVNPAFIQLSIDGTRRTHDSLRGTGDYSRTAAAARRIRSAGIPCFISFTAHRKNYRQFSSVVRLGRKLKVNQIWSDRLIPEGTGKSITELLLTPGETQKFFTQMFKEKMRCSRGFTQVGMNRALQFLEGGDRAYACCAGDSLVTVLANGDLVPCRRMPIPVGNLLENSLEDLYQNSELFSRLRSAIPEACQSCFAKEQCRGGLKCLSCAVNGDPFTPDPGCWRI